MNVLLMYQAGSDPTVRRFFEVPMNGSLLDLPDFHGGTMKLFFADFGGIGDNSGQATVYFDCASPVAVEQSSWENEG